MRSWDAGGGPRWVVGMQVAGRVALCGRGWGWLSGHPERAFELIAYGLPNISNIFGRDSDGDFLSDELVVRNAFHPLAFD